MTWTVLSVRMVHVVLGAFWAGAIFFVALFLEPSVREAGPEGGKVMGILTRRGFLPVLIGVGVVVVLTGIFLLWRLSAGFSPTFMGSRSGILLSTGALSGILALAVGFFVSRPTLGKVGAIMARVGQAGGPPSAEDQAELGRLRARLTMAIRLAAILLLVAVAAMSLGPHV